MTGIMRSYGLKALETLSGKKYTLEQSAEGFCNFVYTYLAPKGDVFLKNNGVEIVEGQLPSLTEKMGFKKQLSELMGKIKELNEFLKTPEARQMGPDKFGIELFLDLMKRKDTLTETLCKRFQKDPQKVFDAYNKFFQFFQFFLGLSEQEALALAKELKDFAPTERKNFLKTDLRIKQLDQHIEKMSDMTGEEMREAGELFFAEEIQWFRENPFIQRLAQFAKFFRLDEVFKKEATHKQLMG